MPYSEDSSWFLAAVGTVVAALAGAVATMFKMLESKNAEAISSLQTHVAAVEERLKENDIKHEECQKDRIKLSVEVALLREQVCRISPPEDDKPQ